ncbi:leucine--tRNA ligase [Spiroplasma endosymbiont of Amphibalanus improvisus]|uniref:leucine--tRNA ligase n=1 Tax=Spiroplasma endosymbiont of Amphibalanus improvisus TaxID=3066327 RepID=UPI00313C2667
MEFSHKAIEKKWQKYWEKNNSFKTNESKKNKMYILDMFPYPSGSGLHVGHPKGYTATDVIARMKRLEGFDVFHPIGFDSFGLPAEQYALKTGNNPEIFTLKNIDNFRKQLKSLGFSFDYSKEIITSQPYYYKTTQWIFSELYKKGLAELKDTNVNWCEELGTVLSNEETLVIDGMMVSERGNYPVIKKPMKQWTLKITKYAEKLLEGLKELDWPQSIKDLQTNWIGKTSGVEVIFDVQDSNKKIKVFTTRVDCIYVVPYLVLSADHPLVFELIDKLYIDKVQKFIQETKKNSDLIRKDKSRPKKGVFIGIYAINPITKEKIPVWLVDYILDFDMAAQMAIPAHDKLDYMFANKYKINYKFAINPKKETKHYILDGPHINSPLINGLNIEQATKKILSELKKIKKGENKVCYKLKDWLFSRQRFWGEPIPIIHWEDGKISLEENLPVILPKTDKIQLSKNGQSPLSNFEDWLYVEKNGRKGLRETNTMPQWAGSCWYYLGFILKIPGQDKLIELTSPEAKEKLNKWLPVDLYIGGQEHAVLHLLYARFWHLFLYDLGVVPVKEPFQKLINQGMILGSDGVKMSKSKGNVINPNDIINSHGADSLRLYEMFLGPIESSLPWKPSGLDAMRKWIDRVYRLIKNTKFVKDEDNLKKEYNYFVMNVTKQLNEQKFNLAVSTMMVFINECYKKNDSIPSSYIQNFIIVMSVFTPHICSEMWEFLGNHNDLTNEVWPKYDQSFLIEEKIKIIVQFNGKLKTVIEINNNISKEEMLLLIKKDLIVENNLKNKTIIKEIVVPNKLVNFVVK